MTGLFIGTVLYGYCGGRFGRDGYGPKRIEAIGHDWIVVRHVNGQPNFFYGNLDELVEFTDHKYMEAE